MGTVNHRSDGTWTTGDPRPNITALEPYLRAAEEAGADTWKINLTTASPDVIALSKQLDLTQQALDKAIEFLKAR